MKRIGIKILGIVQGVGFRPYVYRHACRLNLTGFIQNTVAGVTIEVEGAEEHLERFLRQLQTAVPPHTYIQSMKYIYLDPMGYESFEIRNSPTGGQTAAMILPDVATCPYCVAEIFDQQNRRFQYPFTNCTHCGPRYSIIRKLPYDRCYTSMKKFVMCAACQKEYNEPTDRRFHAQPNACPDCGPRLQLWDREGDNLAEGGVAWEMAVDMLREGKVLAVKGIGGFHLMTDACQAGPVAQLRAAKGHDQKPLAVMCPDIEWAERLCYVTQKERHLLLSPEAPIVLLPKKNTDILAENVAPDNPSWGVMLPYSPLHHLLLRRANIPLVATSGNLAEEPICTDEDDARERLGRIADAFLVHDRPILRPLDDSIVRLIGGRPMVLRRARGYAPLPVPLAYEMPDTVGYGSQLKATVAVSRGRNIFLSQHIGDLENPRTWQTYKSVLQDLKVMFDVRQPLTACDSHPDYLATKLARVHDPASQPVQHHHAHIAACMAENHVSGDVLGISWDGTGWGDDGTVWGGEFLACDESAYRRVWHMRTFPLPGGEQAVREPRRAALGVLWAMGEKDPKVWEEFAPFKSFKKPALKNFTRMLHSGTSCPATSSVGRLFDALASLTGLAHLNHFEGQAAQQVEYAAVEHAHDEHYPFRLHHGQVDWEPMIRAVLADIRAGIPAGKIAAAFQNTLVEMAVGVCHRVGRDRVVISGGCFQNKYLTERFIRRLTEQHYKVYWPQTIPPNDGGIALGQCVVIGSGRRSGQTVPAPQSTGILPCA